MAMTEKSPRVTLKRAALKDVTRRAAPFDD
jgi:hypothetical protein